MKLCISATGPNLDSGVDSRFGRCRYFIFINPSSMEFESFENDSSGASGGAGVQSAKFVADNGAKAVITGNVGPKAYNALNAAGIEIITIEAGILVKEAVLNYQAGKYRPVTGATATEHSGIRG
ncbi:MAG: NifB/NifX family molybdenum-iron cluster-binding protein [Spirochaetes bacterium]|nr:NifB/NifX family molybdenum-iron cluster-binding protein [Spirochaetota bacterium]